MSLRRDCAESVFPGCTCADVATSVSKEEVEGEWFVRESEVWGVVLARRPKEGEWDPLDLHQQKQGPAIVKLLP